MRQGNYYDYSLFFVVTGMTFLIRAAIKISRNLLLLDFSCLNEWIIVF